MAINNTLQSLSGLLKPKTSLTSSSFGLNTSTPMTGGVSANLNPLNSNFLTPKTNSPLGSVVPPATSTSVGKVGTSGGYDTVPGVVPSVQNPNQNTAGIAKAPVASVASTSPTTFTTPSGAIVDQNGGLISAPTTSYQPQTTQAPVKGLFSDVVSSLANQATQTNPMTSEAYNKAQALNAQLSQSRQNQAVAEGQQRLAPIPIGDATGRQQATRNQYLQQQSALSSELQGESNLAGIGQTQQSLTQSGLSSAGGLAQPQNIFGTLTDPTTGLPVNPQQAGQIQNTVTNLAQSVANGSISYQDALSQLGSYGPNVQNTLLQTIQQSNPNFNVNQNIGSSSAQQNIVGTQAQQVATYQSALQQGKNLQSQLADLIGTFGLNPNDINAANQGLQAIARNTSSPQYKILQNYVNDIANTYAQVLTPTGGSQTDTTRSIATSMLDATASGQSILAVMQSLDQAAQAKIAGVTTTGTNAQSNATSNNIYSF